VDASAIGGAPQPCVKLADRAVEGGVEVLRTGLGADHGASSHDGDLDTLAVVDLPGIAFVEQLNVGPDQLLVVAFDLAQFVGDMFPIVIGNLYVAALDDNVHS
jgi:hypothetical protein